MADKNYIKEKFVVLLDQFLLLRKMYLAYKK